jgi:hypothetical protein
MGYSGQWGDGTGGATTIAIGGTGFLFLPPLLMILFRQKYPRWWFDWNLELLRFSNRVGVYLALLDDRARRPTSSRRCGFTSNTRTPARG